MTKKFGRSTVYYEIYHKDGDVFGWGQEEDPHQFIFLTREGAQHYIDKMVAQGWYKPNEVRVRRQTGKVLEEESEVNLTTLDAGLISDTDPDER